MRIECEVCSATYTIEDSQLSDQPIGAQCPYCGHVKLVRRMDANIAGGSPLGSSAAKELGFNAPPPSYPAADVSSGGASGARGMNTMPRTGGYGGGAALNGGPSAGAAGGPFDMPAGGPFDMPAGGPFGMAPPPMSAPGGAPSWRAPQGGGAGPQADRFGEINGFGAPSEQASGAQCQVCATPLTDEFDKVIGLCDVHQRERRGQESGVQISSDAGARWYAQSGGEIVGPLSLEDLRMRIRQGEFSPQDEFSKDGASYGPLSKYQEIAYLATLGLGAEAGVGSRASRPSVAPQIGSPRRTLWRVLAIGVVVAVALGVVMQRSKLETAASRVSDGNRKPATSVSLNPLKRLLANWRASHPDVSGTSHEHLVTARARFVEDTWKGYQDAEKAYERALLLDADDPTAIAGYVENLTIWKHPLLSQEDSRLLKSALDFAQSLAPDNSAVNRALASYYLARGELNPCRTHADKALERDQTDGVAKLILAGCYLEGNVQLAISETEKALRLVPDLRRADRVLAVGYMKVGRYASALTELEDRMKADPKNAFVLLLYGHVLRELGRQPEAERYYKQAVESGGDVQDAQIALGELYIETGNYAGAVAEFKKASELSSSSPERVSRALSGLAHAELLRQRHGESLRLARSALQIYGKNLEALLVQGESALLAGSASTAVALSKRALDIRSGEPAALVLGARGLVALNSPDQAIKQLEEAIANDPQDARLKGILAGVFLNTGGTSRAYALMRQAAESDPLERLSRGRVGPLALSPLAMRDALDSFRRSASDEVNASVASSSIGMLYFHLGDKTRAQDAIARALRIDDSNVTALLYDAQLALDRGDAQRARAAAEHILSQERGSALGHLMLARALGRKGDVANASEQYGAALRSNPGLLVAKVELAGLSLKGAERDQAVQELARAFQLNPNSYITRKLLFEASY